MFFVILLLNKYIFKKICCVYVFIFQKYFWLPVINPGVDMDKFGIETTIIASIPQVKIVTLLLKTKLKIQVKISLQPAMHGAQVSHSNCTNVKTNQKNINKP